MHPVLTRILGFPLYSCAVNNLLAFLLSAALALWLGRLRRYPWKLTLGLWTVTASLAALGCRLGVVVQSPVYFAQHPLAVLNPFGGTVMGGLLFSTASVWLLGRRKGWPGLDLLDFLAPPLLLCMAWVRVGCLLHGCCFGRLSQVPWAITYPAGNLGRGVPGGPRHPAPLYEMGLDLGLLAGLLWLGPRQRYAGQGIYALYAGYGVIRFLGEMTRDVPVGTPFTLYQWAALAFLGFGALGLAGAWGRPPVRRDWPTVS